MDAAAIVQWVKDNWMDLAFAYTSLVTLASIVVKLTPNKKDDEILAKIMAFVGKYIALNKDTKKSN